MPTDWHCTAGCKSPGDCDQRQKDGACVYEYEARLYAPVHRWSGEGPPPRRWTASDGTVVYRTFADYCD